MTKNTTSMKTLAPSASNSTFKMRNLITKEDCAAVFRIIWDGVMNIPEVKDPKYKYNPRDYINEKQVRKLVSYAAEILNK